MYQNIRVSIGYSLKNFGETIAINDYYGKTIIKEKFCFFSWNYWEESRVYYFLENVTHADSVWSTKRSSLHLAVTDQPGKGAKKEGWIEIPCSHWPFGTFYK